MKNSFTKWNLFDPSNCNLIHSLEFIYCKFLENGLLSVVLEKSFYLILAGLAEQIFQNHKHYSFSKNQFSILVESNLNIINIIGLALIGNVKYRIIYCSSNKDLVAQFMYSIVPTNHGSTVQCSWHLAQLGYVICNDELN